MSAIFMISGGRMTTHISETTTSQVRLDLFPSPTPGANCMTGHFYNVEPSQHPGEISFGTAPVYLGQITIENNPEIQGTVEQIMSTFTRVQQAVDRGGQAQIQPGNRLVISLNDGLGPLAL